DHHVPHLDRRSSGQGQSGENQWRKKHELHRFESDHLRISLVEPWRCFEPEQFVARPSWPFSSFRCLSTRLGWPCHSCSLHLLDVTGLPTLVEGGFGRAVEPDDGEAVSWWEGKLLSQSFAVWIMSNPFPPPLRSPPASPRRS